MNCFVWSEFNFVFVRYDLIWLFGTVVYNLQVLLKDILELACEGLIQQLNLSWNCGIWSSYKVIKLDTLYCKTVDKMFHQISETCWLPHSDQKNANWISLEEVQGRRRCILHFHYISFLSLYMLVSTFRTKSYFFYICFHSVLFCLQNVLTWCNSLSGNI